ncbi:NPCBM/NEW2 domain-containing protein [Nonomuraea sp. 3N208]|uniref:NPCBM/NEW2 domain-containing protein n=1 Tax=Nonomuraea sp. 3N208 TaxID=3457421 RepID=UPI003FCDB9C0
MRSAPTAARCSARPRLPANRCCSALAHWSTDSGLITHADPPQQIAVDLTGTTTLDLAVEDGGDGTNFDHADWADPSITCTW